MGAYTFSMNRWYVRVGWYYRKQKKNSFGIHSRFAVHVSDPIIYQITRARRSYVVLPIHAWIFNIKIWRETGTGESGRAVFFTINNMELPIAIHSWSQKLPFYWSFILRLTFVYAVPCSTLLPKKFLFIRETSFSFCGNKRQIDIWRKSSGYYVIKYALTLHSLQASIIFFKKSFSTFIFEVILK